MKTIKALSGLLILLMMDGLQAQEIIFEKTLGREGTRGVDMVQTPNQSYLIVGRKEVSDNTEGFLVKVNEQGDTLLKKRFGKPSFNAITSTTDGHYLTVASENPNNTNNPNAYLTKIDSAGNIVWEDELGGPNPKVAYNIEHIKNNSYVVTGFAFRTDEGRQDADVFGMKMSSGGQAVDWIEYYGGPEFEEAITAKPTQDGGLLFAGGTYSFSQKPGETDDLYLIKTNLQGDTLWTFTYGIEGQYDWANDWSQAANGDYLVTGLKDNSNNEEFQDGEVMLIRVSEKGNLVWDQSFDIGAGRGEGHLISNINNDHFAVSGTSVSSQSGIDPFVTEVNSSGERQWSKNMTFGSDQEYDIANTMIKNAQNQLLLSGLKNASRDYSGDMFLAKLSTSTSSTQWKEAQNSNFEIYPNPATPGESLTIIRQEKSESSQKIKLLNAKGQVQQRKQVHPNTDQIRLSLSDSLSSGLYFLKVKTKNKNPSVYKVILR